MRPLWAFSTSADRWVCTNTQFNVSLWRFAYGVLRSCSLTYTTDLYKFPLGERNNDSLVEFASWEKCLCPVDVAPRRIKNLYRVFHNMNPRRFQHQLTAYSCLITLFLISFLSATCFSSIYPSPPQTGTAHQNASLSSHAVYVWTAVPRSSRRGGWEGGEEEGLYERPPGRVVPCCPPPPPPHFHPGATQAEELGVSPSSVAKHILRRGGLLKAGMSPLQPGNQGGWGDVYLSN